MTVFIVQGLHKEMTNMKYLMSTSLKLVGNFIPLRVETVFMVPTKLEYANVPLTTGILPLKRKFLGVVPGSRG